MVVTLYSHQIFVDFNYNYLAKKPHKYRKVSFLETYQQSSNEVD